MTSSHSTERKTKKSKRSKKERKGRKEKKSKHKKGKKISRKISKMLKGKESKWSKAAVDLTKMTEEELGNHFGLIAVSEVLRQEGLRKEYRAIAGLCLQIPWCAWR